MLPSYFFIFFTKLVILLILFLPLLSSTPDDKSTFLAFVLRRASVILFALSPPAKNHEKSHDFFSNIVQSNLIPLPPGKLEFGLGLASIRR